MKRNQILLMIAVLALSLGACRKKDLYEPIDTSPKPAALLEGEIIKQNPNQRSGLDTQRLCGSKKQFRFNHPAGYRN